MSEHKNSVTLDQEKCKGCTNCIKTCPTEAIRVRNGKAYILVERCIDCGECIRVCPHHAKVAIADKISMIKKYKKVVALPAPTMYGQFSTRYSRSDILNSIKTIGFDAVFEVAAGAEVISKATEEILRKSDLKPLISSACPAVVRLIQIRFPSLIDHIIKIESPMEISAIMARKIFAEKFDIDESDLGIFFISPCAAKITAVKDPIGLNKSEVDGVIPISDVYGMIVEGFKHISNDQSNIYSSEIGIGWAGSGGEASAIKEGKKLAVDGIQNVIKVFEQIENEKIENVSFIEALACPEGCLGGPLTVENRYVAKARLRQHMEDCKNENIQKKPEALKIVNWTKTLQPINAMQLDDDMMIALEKFEQIDEITKTLPGLDCGACGAPNCRALAEDIVRGIAKDTDCLFKLRDKVRELASEMMELESELPPSMNRKDNES